MSSLIVSLDAVAIMREIRGRGEPEPTKAATLAELAGAEGLSIQMRANGRPMRIRDLRLMVEQFRNRLTVEMPPTEDMLKAVSAAVPSAAILIADQAAGQGLVTTIDFNSAHIDYSGAVAQLNGAGCEVGIFIEPEPTAVKGVAKAGANSVLLSCAAYTSARTIDDQRRELERLGRAAEQARKSGLGVLAGRGLDYDNIGPLAALDLVDEFMVGFAINARAMLVGYDRAVSEMIRQINRAIAQG